MKKIVLLFTGLTLIINTARSQDKSFHEGAIVVDAGIGLSVFSTKANDTYDVKINGSNVRVTENKTDAAAATVIPVTIEYGLKSWLGVGVRFGYSKYFGGADSTNNHTKPTVKGFDGDLILNFHFIKTKHFDMPISFSCGYSNFKYEANDAMNSMAKDNGLTYGIALVPRIYFGDHIGIFFNLGYTGYTYPSLLFSNNSNSNLNAQNNQVYKFKGSGGTGGLGLVVKF